MAARTGRAFGLDVESTFGLPGLGGVLAGERPCRLRDGDPAELRAGWPADAAVIMRRPATATERGLDVDRAADGRWRLSHPGAGTAYVGADATFVACAREAELPFARFLVGQVLPLAALLQGLEPFHAGAVRLGDGVVAFGGPSLAGKTTLALALVAAGAELVTDDVLALETAGDGVLAHPGAGIANVRHDTVRLLGLDTGGALPGDDGVRLVFPVVARALPLRRFYLLAEGPLGFTAPGALAWRELLATSFNLAVTDPARLARQFDLCGRIAADVGLVRASFPAELHPHDCAAALAADALSDRGAG